MCADGEPRPLATTIYYLLTHDDPIGVFHMNKSAVSVVLSNIVMCLRISHVADDPHLQTMHVLHQGRAEYTLIYPENPPRVERVVCGPSCRSELVGF